jgi:two-component system NtrC family sensor kinase
MNETALAEADVLIVEDDPAVRNVMERVLVDHGYTVQTAANGAEALVAVEDNRYLAIVCDVKMPQVDGMQLYAYLEMYHPALARCVLFVTGVPGAPGVMEFLRQTGCRVLWKPYEIRLFLDAVVELVGRQPTTGMLH